MKCMMSASVNIIVYWAWLIISLWEIEPKSKETTVNYFALLKLVYQNKNELPGTSMAFGMIVSRFEKSHYIPIKILSSFALTAQPHQNIANRSD